MLGKVLPILTVIVWLLEAPAALWAQPINPPETILDVVDPNSFNNQLTFSRRYDAFEGSPYLYESWIPAKVYTQGGKVLEDLPIQYDLYTHELLAKYEVKVVTLSTKAVEKFIMKEPGKSSATSFRRFPDLLKEGYFVEVYRGEMSVWKGWEVRLAKQENNAGGYGQGGNSREIQRFIRKEIWYVHKSEGEKPVRFSPTKKELILLFPEHEQTLKAYIKTHKLKLKSEEDWVDVFSYLDSL